MSSSSQGQGANPQCAPSLDLDADHMSLQHPPQQEYDHLDARFMSHKGQHLTLPMPDYDDEEARAEKSIREFPFHDRGRLESNPQQMGGISTPFKYESLVDDCTSRMPHSTLPYSPDPRLPMQTKESLLSVLDDGHRSGNITPKAPPVLVPNVYSPTEIMGTIINCPGAIAAFKVPIFAETAVSAFEAVFHSEDRQPHLPALVELPLWMRPHNNNDTIDHDNDLVRCLWVNANLDHPGFGTSPVQKGSRLVMRRDGLNLLPQHLEALCNFCAYALHKSCGATGLLSSEPRIYEKQKKTFRRMVTRKGFEEFWRQYCVKRALDDERWEDLPSPYERAKLGVEYRR